MKTNVVMLRPVPSADRRSQAPILPIEIEVDTETGEAVCRYDGFEDDMYSSFAQAVRGLEVSATELLGDELDRARLQVLRAEAGAAGDDEQVELCERARRMFPDDEIDWRRGHCIRAAAIRRGLNVGPVARSWPLPNVWLGVSVENQAAADERITLLLQLPAAVRWLSCEPLLGPVDLKHAGAEPVDWVVIGGESGPKARPCEVRWIRSLLKQCQSGGVPAFVKQLGSCSIAHETLDMGEDAFMRWDAGDNGNQPMTWGERAPYRDSKGGDMNEWPEHLRVREYPEVQP